MSRSRYRFTNPDQAHFLTWTMVEWLPVFTRQETVEILFDSWGYLSEHRGLKLYGYVVLENPLHAVAQAENLPSIWSSFTSYTARQIIGLLEARQAEALLKRMRFASKAHRDDREHQFWQEDSYPQAIENEVVLRRFLPNNIPACLSFRPSSALWQPLHSPTMRLSPGLEHERES
jgi:hypothetical protein